MKAGDKDRTIEFWNTGPEVDTGYGTAPGEPALQFTRKASKIEARSKEIFANAGAEVELPAIFEVYSDSETRTVMESWTVRYEGRAYNIRSISEIGRHRGLRFECVAGDAQ